jgi:hypothetical protein
MQNILKILGIVVLLAACHPDKKKPILVEKPAFNTSDASELFFKNVRQSEYNLKENKTAGINIFTHQDLDSSWIVTPQIIHNWRTDKAYVMLRWHTDITIPVTLKVNQQEIEFTGSPIGNHNLIAGHIYNAILSQEEVLIQQSANWIPLFDSPKKEEVFRITLFDFYRLVDLR